VPQGQIIVQQGHIMAAGLMVVVAWPIAHRRPRGHNRKL